MGSGPSTLMAPSFGREVGYLVPGCHHLPYCSTVPVSRTARYRAGILASEPYEGDTEQSRKLTNDGEWNAI